MRFTFHYFHLPDSFKGVPPSIKSMLLALFLYTIGWGFINAVFSVYVSQLVGSYSAYGIIIGVMYLACLLSALVAGGLADVVDKRKLVGWSMLAYPFLAALYFFGYAIGFAGLAFTRVAHGVFSTSVWVGAEAEINSSGGKKDAPKYFGLFSFTEYLAALVGALLLAILVWVSVINLSNLNYVFLVVAATSLLAGLWLKSQGDSNPTHIRSQLRSVLSKSAMKAEAKDILSFDKHMWATLVFAFLTAMIIESLSAFIPLFALQLNLGLIGVVLLYIVFLLPLLFSFFTSNAAHFVGETNAIFFALIASGVLMASLYFVDSFSLYFVLVIFLLVVCQALLKPSINALLNQLGEGRQPGEIAGA
ncbi:MFS transporter, partial [Candidatus Micrarchaeota archaeon]|nr:MFS transporter [Candidatus Micrarchaeota archaeon]